ncbi:MAG: Segregation and condensation protein B [Parcubacteria group bacterium GW2011_GWA2_51_10]|nr:MAG: Segregation and condensation protein B [Parcubacteria group bacterium GW2011_GWA2_51_10]
MISEADANKLSLLALRAESLLFAEGRTLERKRLAQLAECSTSDLSQALDLLESRLSHGIALIRTETEVGLAVAPKGAEFLARAYEREREKDIGEAGLEVLAILLYRGPSTKADIDYMRGVNTFSTLRTLLMRGLIARANNPNDGREYVYTPTTELLAHLGVTDAKALPDYDTIAGALAAFESNQSNHADDD